MDPDGCTYFIVHVLYRIEVSASIRRVPHETIFRFYAHVRSDMRVHESTFSRPSDLGRAGI